MTEQHVGALDVRNALAEIASAGSGAQASARQNIGALQAVGGDASETVVIPVGGSTPIPLNILAASITNPTAGLMTTAAGQAGVTQSNVPGIPV